MFMETHYYTTILSIMQHYAFLSWKELWFVGLLFYSSLCFFPFQGFYQLLEPKVTVRCREQDVEVVQVRY